MRRWTHTEKFYDEGKFSEAYEWCKQTFGDSDKQRWHAVWNVYSFSTISVRDPKDVMIFRLKWM